LCFYIVDYAFDTVFIKESCLGAIQQLKQAIVTESGKLLQRFIDRAIGYWRCRLEGRHAARRTK